MIYRKYGKANPNTERFEQDVKDGKCKTKNAWWHVQEKIYDLAKCRVFAPLCYDYRDWQYNSSGEPMPISCFRMSVSLIRALEKSPEIRFQKVKRFVNTRIMIIFPLLAQLIGLVDYLKEWKWKETDYRRGAYIDLDAILEILRQNDEDDLMPPLEKMLTKAFDFSQQDLLTKQEMKDMNSQIAAYGAALPRQKTQKNKQ